MQTRAGDSGGERTKKAVACPRDEECYFGITPPTQDLRMTACQKNVFASNACWRYALLSSLSTDNLCTSNDIFTFSPCEKMEKQTLLSFSFAPLPHMVRVRNGKWIQLWGEREEGKSLSERMKGGKQNIRLSSQMVLRCRYGNFRLLDL